jgi:hypothetical protein
MHPARSRPGPEASYQNMLTISKDPVTDALAHTLAQSVGAVVGITFNDEQRTALLLIASTLKDSATIGDLIVASGIDVAAQAAIPSETIGHFSPLRTALQAVATARVQVPLFELFESDRRVLAHKLDGAPTHMQTQCPQCGDRLRWAATSWRDIKRRPHRCSNGTCLCIQQRDVRLTSKGKAG